MNALTVLLLCLAAANAVPAHFPAEKTVIYNYYADVKTGIMEPAQYASQFALTGQLHVKKDVSDPTLNNAYYIKLNNVKYGMYNGMVTVHYQPVEVFHELGEAAQQIQEPFVIVYDESGKFQGIKMPETESGWSMNIKQGIASMLQLDLVHIQVQTPMKPHSFVTHENTIHGTCQVAYDVHPKRPTNPENNVFVVTKIHDLKNCSHFVQRIFDHFECEKCHMESVDDMTTFARRVFEIKQQDNDILIEHMVAHSAINYFPYNSQSEAHYLSTNTTLVLHSVVPTTEVSALTVNVQNVPLIRDVTFNKPLGNYALHAAEDLTHGRHIVKLDVLIPKLKKMLAEAADYLEENHLEAEEPEWKHGQTINRLQHTMSYMDLGSLEQVYNAIQDPKTPKEVTIKNIFLQMIPTVGTTAACHFVRNVVRKHKVTDTTAVAMLTKLPLHVKIPSGRLLLEMEDLLKFGDTVSPQVRKASIFSFSILIRKTFIHQQNNMIYPLLERYLHRFFDHVKNEQSYEMKMVYLMAMKNVQMGIEKFLEPIIRGEVTISENPHHIRVQAIWAIKKAVADKVEYTHHLLWPIFTDVTQLLSIRIAAYDVLMSQMPNMQRIMNIYWFMIYEQNNHLYNYHFTTLKGLANSVNPCLMPVREMARKVLRFTRIRAVTTQLSSKYFVDYTDPMYEYGESWNNAWVFDELTGMPYAGYVEYHASVARKSVDKVGIYWNAYGLDEIMKMVKKELVGTTVENLTNKNVQNILIQAAQDMPIKKPVHIDICITINGFVVAVDHFDQNSFKKMFSDYTHQLKQMMTGNFQEMTYDTLYEMQVPTDIGLQAVFSIKMPKLSSLKFNYVRTEVKKPSVNIKFDVDARIWKHGEYVMSVYNPIVDVWHSIRRVVVQDVAFPVQMSVGYNHEAKSFKVTMPRLPVTKPSITGIRFYAKNLVTVIEDEQDVLKTCCATCHHHTVVTTGEKKNHHVTMDSKDVGLKYSMSIFDCENEITQVTNAQEWQRVFSAEHKNTWNSKLLQYIIGIRQKLINDYISPKMGNCGMLLKMEPSIVYPTSHVDLNVRVSVEEVDNIQHYHAFSGHKINVRSTVDAKAASTNESIRSWDVNVNIDMSPGHMVNNLKVQMMRKTPGEKNLNVCVDAQKTYPVVDTDPLKVDIKEEINSKITITAGFTDDDKCVRDNMTIVMTVKGEMTEEQKRQMAYDNVHGACVEDTKSVHVMFYKPFYKDHNTIAKTMNCVRQNLQYSTMKKYTINATYKKVPVQVSSIFARIEDHIRSWYLPHMKYIMDRAENGNAKVVIEYSFDMTHVNATVITPVNGYEYVQVPLQQQGPLFDGMVVDKPVPQPQWHFLMDNTHFPISAVYKMTQGRTKICSMYSQTLITLDEGDFSAIFLPWILMSGDYIDQTYAIFARRLSDEMVARIAMKMYIADHEMEITSNESNIVVTVDGNTVDHEKGVMVPKDEPQSFVFKLTVKNNHFLIQSQRVPVMVIWTPVSLSIMVDTSLQGHVTGLCGHMDGTHKETMPKPYREP